MAELPASTPCSSLRRSTTPTSQESTHHIPRRILTPKQAGSESSDPRAVDIGAHGARADSGHATAGSAVGAFWGCDDEHSQAHGRVGVRLSDPAGSAATRLRMRHSQITDIEPGRLRVEVVGSRCGLFGDASVATQRSAAARLRTSERTGSPRSTSRPGFPFRLANPAGREGPRIRTDVARELFAAEHGRPPRIRELAGAIAKHSRPGPQSVAGYDLTFSPVKSVSTLWAVADPQTARQIERAHQAAVHDALRFLEQHALFTREGPQGIRQVNVRGLVTAAFTHRDSRAGDPDLHTHVAVANNVQTLDGRWLSIDGRVLFKATVAASETYNTPRAPSPRPSGGAVRGRARHRPAETSGARDRRCRPSAEPALVYPPNVDQGPAG